LKINEDIARIVFGEEYSIPSKPEAIDLDLKIYDEYVGTYEDDWCKFDVKRDGGKLHFI